MFYCVWLLFQLYAGARLRITASPRTRSQRRNKKPSRFSKVRDLSRLKNQNGTKPKGNFSTTTTPNVGFRSAGGIALVLWYECESRWTMRPKTFRPGWRRHVQVYTVHMHMHTWCNKLVHADCLVWIALRRRWAPVDRLVANLAFSLISNVPLSKTNGTFY